MESGEVLIREEEDVASYLVGGRSDRSIVSKV